MKKHLIIHWHGGLIITAFLLFGCFKYLLASPTSDLASPSPEVRDAAAKILRETYVAPSRTNWDSLVNKLKLGDPMTNVLDVLARFTNNIEGGFGSGATETERYRLDDLWMLECSHVGSDSDCVLTHLNILQGLRSVEVEPLPRYTGKWITYYVNGQKSGEGQYKDGKLNGDGVGFYTSGETNLVHHWVNGVSDGEEIGFYPSGRVKYRGLFKNDVQAGKWTWYNEDGSVKSTQDHSKP